MQHAMIRPDVNVLLLRSRGVASVSTKASFTPDKINIFNKDCDVAGRKLTCFNTHLCFSAAFRPNNPVGPVGKYHLVAW